MTESFEHVLASHLDDGYELLAEVRSSPEKACAAVVWKRWFGPMRLSTLFGLIRPPRLVYLFTHSDGRVSISTRSLADVRQELDATLKVTAWVRNPFENPEGEHNPAWKTIHEEIDKLKQEISARQYAGEDELRRRLAEG